MAQKQSRPNVFSRLLSSVDEFQQRHKFLAFPYAVVKKFSDDEAGYQGALMAYYGFLSLFPLLIVATAVIQIVAKKDTGLRDQLFANITSYFPAIGDNLAASIQSPSKTGFALVIGLLITFYGAKGVADAVQHAQNHLWAVPRAHRAGFPKAMLRSFGIIVGAGLGLVISAALTGYATGADHNFLARILLGTTGFVVLFSVFWGIFTFGSSARKRPIANVPGALFGAVGLTLLQALGGYLVTTQLRSQTGLNAQFAIVLALLFWLYLQAQVFLYAIEINTVRVHHLWPRSITPKPPLPADEKAYELYRHRETFVVTEGIHH